MSIEQGVLYVVATPIGNLQDLSPRARQVLGGVDVVLAEDTRLSARLLNHFGIATPMLPFHQHNERRACPAVVRRLAAAQSVALICDAGTPLISDPGYHLVQAVRAAGYKLCSIPGPCAIVASLAVAGLPTDRFVFEGFLPPRRPARRDRLSVLRHEQRTLVIYEVPHRVRDCVADMYELLGADRRVTLTRELTKIYEETFAGTLRGLSEWLHEKERVQGEIVIVIAGAAGDAPEHERLRHLVATLLKYLPARQAVAASTAISGAHKNQIYRLMLEITSHRDTEPGKPEVSAGSCNSRENATN
ncbi:MAG: 16S rRNA (cytidine(1402)-2'-O)-methyltransferase [Gammaproteobacteria bacterium]